MSDRLQEFAATNAMLRAVLGPEDTEGPILDRWKLAPHSREDGYGPLFQGPAVLAAGLSVIVNSVRYAYSGPIQKQDLDRLEIEMLAYLRSFS